MFKFISVFTVTNIMWEEKQSRIFSKEFTLPFVPYVGLKIEFNDDVVGKQYSYKLTVENITWEDKKKRFRVLFKSEEYVGFTSEEIDTIFSDCKNLTKEISPYAGL